MPFKKFTLALLFTLTKIQPDDFEFILNIKSKFGTKVPDIKLKPQKSGGMLSGLPIMLVKKNVSFSLTKQNLFLLNLENQGASTHLICSM